MQISRIVVFLFVICIQSFFVSCTNETVNSVAASNKKNIQDKAPEIAITIDVQPFDDISESQVRYVLTELKKVYPNTVLKKSIPLPAFAYYKPRHRYKADSLISYLSKQSPKDHVTIGLISKDISTTKDAFPDWGVMGLGYCPGNACIVSTFRLSTTETSLQLFKVAVHELGHTQGLPHCEVKTCFMRDAEGKNPTSEEKEFCPKCTKVLVNKGWQL